MTDDRCPPHFFQHGWRTDALGLIWCRFCGEVRDLEPQNVGPPVEESIQSITVTDKQP